MSISFNNLPEAVGQLVEKVNSIEGLLQKLQTTQIQPEQSELLTIQQAADILKLSVPTIYGLVSRAEIPYAKKGKRLYFSKQELLDWVQSGRKKTNAEIAATACSNKRKLP